MRSSILPFALSLLAAPVLGLDGTGRFEEAVYLDEDSASADVQVADLDGDGFPDLVSALEGSTNLALYFGEGDGEFAATVLLAGSIETTAVALADLNGDGAIDLVLGGMDDRVRTRLGNGDGTFAPERIVSRGGASGWLRLDQLNGDAVLDLVTATSPQGEVRVSLGLGDGSFAGASVIQVGGPIVDGELGDLNQDGVLDLVVAISEQDRIARMIGAGGGAFAAPTSHPTEPLPIDIELVELTFSGGPEIVVLARRGTSPQQQGSLEYFGHTLSGNLILLRSELTGPILTGDLLYTDLTGDGTQERILAGAADDDFLGGLAQDGIWVSTALSGWGVGEFETRSRNVLGAGIRSITLADLDGDGLEDLLAASPSAGAILAMRSDPFSFATARLHTAAPNPTAIALFDTTGDGNPELFTASKDDDRLRIYRGSGNGTYSEAGDLITFASPSALANGDVNGDGSTDLAVACTDADRCMVWFGNGFSGFGIDPAVVVTGTGPSSVSMGDLNGDGLEDLVCAISGAAKVTVFLSQGGGFPVGTDVPAGPSPGRTALSDLDGDGALDIVVTNLNGFRVLLGNGNGMFQSGIDRSGGILYSDLVATDLFGNGTQDLAFASDGVVDVWRNLGGGQLAGPDRYPGGTSADQNRLVAGDIDGDGVVDLLATAAGPRARLLVGDGAVGFIEVDGPIVGASSSLVLGHFNEDGALDVAGTRAEEEQIFVALGVESVPTNYCTGSPNSAGAGAFIGSFGSISVQTGDLGLTVVGAPANVMGLFFYGSAQVQLPFGDGVRCVGGGTTGLFRLGPASTNALGSLQQALDFSVAPIGAGPGQVHPGQTKNFQFWYRDPAQVGGAGFNLSDALSVRFCP